MLRVIIVGLVCIGSTACFEDPGPLLSGDGDGDGDHGDGDPGDGDPGDTGDTGDGDGDCVSDLDWADVECIDMVCVARPTCAGSWTRVVHSSDLDTELQAEPIGPCFPDGFSQTRCIQAGTEIKCFVGDGVWFAPFTCAGSVGSLGWPAWMCGASTPVTSQPWDAAGCHDELDTSCVAMIGAAAFEIWPDCYIQTLL